MQNIFLRFAFHKCIMHDFFFYNVKIRWSESMLLIIRYGIKDVWCFFMENNHF